MIKSILDYSYFINKTYKITKLKLYFIYKKIIINESYNKYINFIYYYLNLKDSNTKDYRK